MIPDRRPVRVAIVNDYEIVVAGLAALVEAHADRVEIVAVEAGNVPGVPVDVALYDTFAMPGARTPAIDDLVGQPGIGCVVLYTWNITPAMLAEVQRHKVWAVLPKSLSAVELVAALEAAHRGEADLPVPMAPVREIGAAYWPGKAQGLTPRESEVISLIVQGVSNEEIADWMYLSINSVKSYIRSAYRTMGVTTRSQAILWGVDHGMRPARETWSSQRRG